MAKPTLHLIGIFHTIHSHEYSSCAFTGKALRFAKMVQPYGYNVVEYANEGSESEAREKVVMLNRDEFERTLGEKHRQSAFFGDLARVDSEWHHMFEDRALEALRKRLRPRDIVCHPFGHAHERIVRELPGYVHVETGIGYPTLLKGAMKIFESYAWMHYHQGRENRNGSNYEWVIPNYFDLDDWEPSYEPGTYIAFLGRVGVSKGMDTVVEIAKRINMPIKVAGQGDITPWQHPNIEHVGVLKGRERSEFLRNAFCQLMPTEFVEPFGGSGVEGLLCGTPLIARDFGAFAETVQQGFNGYRCHVLKQWLGAIQAAGKLDRRKIADAARARYSLQTCGLEYDVVFRQITDLYEDGWYTIPRSEELEAAQPFKAPMGPLRAVVK